MPQALRKLRRPEHSRKKMTVSILLLLTCALVSPGCATLGLSDQLFSDSDSGLDEQSTIRSQNSSEADNAARRTETVSVDYSPLNATIGSSVTDSAASANGNGVIPVFATGHAFVQRRAKLGKPIPIRDKIEPGSAERTESIGTPATFQNSNTTENPEPVPVQTPVVRDGISFGAAGWLPAPNDSIAGFGSPSASTPREKNLTQSPDAWNSEGLQNSQNEPAINGEQTVPPSQFDSKGPLPEETNAPTSSADSSIAIDAEDPAAATVTPDNSAAREPTVLDRLRGLYTPRRDEAALERSRKANRRWTDPFGLMREREPETVDAAVGATSPLPSNPEASPTADPVDTTASMDNDEALLEPLIAKLEQQLAEWPRHTNGAPENLPEWRQHQTDLRLLYLIAGRSAESMRAIESLPEKEQEFWQSMMLAMEAYRSSSDSADRTEQLTETLNYVRTASRQLQPLSTMKIRRMSFCNRIEGFGSFDVFPGSDFKAGQPLLLYAEIENYRSELTDDGEYRSEFAAKIQFIRDGETEPIASRTIDLPEIEDRCIAERTDYFQSYELTIPTLSPGRYILRLRVDDQLTQQTATSDLPFDIRPLGGAR